MGLHRSGKSKFHKIMPLSLFRFFLFTICCCGEKSGLAAASSTNIQCTACGGSPWRSRTCGSCPWRSRTCGGYPWCSRTFGGCPWRQRLSIAIFARLIIFLSQILWFHKKVDFKFIFLKNILNSLLGVAKWKSLRKDVSENKQNSRSFLPPAIAVRSSNGPSCCYCCWRGHCCSAPKWPCSSKS